MRRVAAMALLGASGSAFAQSEPASRPINPPSKPIAAQSENKSTTTPTKLSEPPAKGSASETRAPRSVIAAPTSEPAKKIQFAFREAPWDQVLEWLADLSGKSLLLEAKPPGSFSYFDTKAYTLPQAIDVLNSVLLDKGYAVLMRDNFLIAADIREGIPPHLVQRVEITDLPRRGRTELVKVLLTLQGLVAEEAKKEFESLKGPHGSVIALPSTNQLLLIDTARNVEQIVELIKQIEGGEGKADLRAFPLKHVSALEVERVVRDLLGVTPREFGNRATPAPAATPSRDPRERFGEMIMSRMMGGMGGPPGGAAPPAPPGAPPRTGPTPGSKGPFVSIDERTNTLFVSATPDKLALVAEVVKSLDVAPTGGPEETLQTPRIEVYPVAAGSAEGLAKVMEGIVGRSPEVRVSPHPDGRALIVYATPREHARLREVLAQLKTEGLRVDVIQLRALDAASTVDLIKGLLGQKEQQPQSRSRFPFFFDRDSRSDDKKPTGPVVEADVERNRLLVRGTDSQIEEVRELLSKLGETGLATGDKKGLGKSRFRVIPLGGRDPKETAETIRRLWTRLDHDRPLKIEIMGDSSVKEPQRDLKSTPSSPPAADERPRSQWSPTPAPSNDQHDSQVAILQRVGHQVAEEKDVRPSADGKRPVTIVVGPENLAITSDDPEALDLIENLANSLVRGQSASTSGFAIYYLKAAEAQDLSYLIDEAINGARSNFEETTPKARILPDQRTNALLVVGPVGEQRKVEALLEVLDRTDPPETQVASVPRMIKVKYGSADDIAQVVKDVFAQQVFQQARQGQQAPNAPQGFSSFGFGGGGGRNRQPVDQKPKITIGVDRQTNTIIVSAPQDTFDEIKGLVTRLDEGAKDNGRTARVVTLRNARPDAVQRAMVGLFGVRTAETRAQERRAQEAAANSANQAADSQGIETRLRDIFRGGRGEFPRRFGRE